MPKITITGWRKGCNTVAAIKEIREKASIPLNEAAALVNRVLGNEPVVVPVSTIATARALVDSLEGIGLTAISIDD